MSTLNINQTMSAFTKLAKNGAGDVLRHAIPRFEFPVNLAIDLTSDKMKQVISTLLTERLKVAVQNQDRAELWDKETIAAKFEASFARFDEEAIYRLVCVTGSSNFGLKSWIEWVKAYLIPAIAAGTGKELSAATIATITKVCADGKRMAKPSMEKVLQWIEAYAMGCEEVERALGYLSGAEEEAIVDLDALGF